MLHPALQGGGVYGALSDSRASAINAVMPANWVSLFSLYLGATHTNTGRLRLLREHELSLDVLLASVCLPKIHHAVDIDGQPYWDGGYAANPAMFPLLQEGKVCDILLVLLAPHQHSDTPHQLAALLFD